MAIGRSATPLISIDAVAVDTETTGLDPRNSRIVEMGAVRIVGGRPDERQTLRRLVRPEEPIPAAATRIHGIDAAAVADAPSFAAAWPEFSSYLGDTIVVGHSIAFDFAMLQRECERGGITWQSPPALDVRLLAQVAEPNLADHSLESLATWLGVEVSGRHSALGDAVSAARIFRALVPKLRERGIRTLAEAMRASGALVDAMEAQHRSGWSELAPIWNDTATAGTTARGDVYLYRHRVGTIMSAPAASVPADMIISAALELMMSKRVSSLFVSPDGGPSRPETTGIVTERDILRALAEHGVAGLTTPVGKVMSKPLVTVAADALAYAAIGRMNWLKIRHLGVTDASGNVIGALSARDLLRLRAEGAVELGDEIEQAKDVHDLGHAWARLPKIAEALVQEGLSAGEVAAVVSQRVREMTQHAAVLAESAMRDNGLGGPPSPYAFVVLGSASRDESLLAMDQDNALVYADNAPTDADAWFQAFSTRAADILHQAGIPLCKGGVMAKNPQWRGSLATWRGRIAKWIENSNPQDLLSVDIFFDLRVAHGDAALADTLSRHAFDAASGQTVFAKQLIESAEFAPSGLTWFGSFRTNHGRIDLKKAGLFGIVSTARALAICHRIVERSTPTRLRGLQALNLGLEQDIDALIDAQGVFLDLILAQQIDDIGHGRPVGNAVEVKRLSRRDRARLHTALRSVEHLDDIARTLLFKG